MSRDANFVMGLGGVVRMRGWYDWDGGMPNNGFIPYNIAIPKNPARSKWLGSTPAGTALYFRVLGTNARVGDYQLYIEANFDGYNQRGFLLKKAYATINDWTIGYAHSTFSDPLAEPLLVDGQGPNAYVSTTAVLVRWMHNLRKDWIMAASMEMPQAFVGANGTTTQSVDDWMPNVAAFSQYGYSCSTDDGLRVGRWFLRPIDSAPCGCCCPSEGPSCRLDRRFRLPSVRHSGRCR